MPYKSRAIYKEEGKVRDYNLFVIVAEGSKREVEYLMPFDIVDRIKVLNIPQTTEEKFLKELPHIDVVFDQNGVASIRINK